MNDTDIIRTSNPPLLCVSSSHLQCHNIAETVQKNTDIVPKQLAAHGITIPHVIANNYLVAQNGKVNQSSRLKYKSLPAATEAVSKLPKLYLTSVNRHVIKQESYACLSHCLNREIIAPPDILNPARCSCESCSTVRCSCSSAKIALHFGL